MTRRTDPIFEVFDAEDAFRSTPSEEEMQQIWDLIGHPELFAVHASLVILIACGTVVAFVVPITVHPLLLGLVPASIGIFGSLAVANYHHRG